MASKVKVLYNFDGEQANNELTIHEGEILTVVNPNIGDGWWEGINARGAKGLFPEAYVEPISNSVAIPSAPPVLPRSQASNTGTSFDTTDGDSWDDDWEEDEESVHSHETSSQHNGEVRHRTMTSGRGTTIKKSLNRFSVFVKSGGESFLLGATTADNKNIMANDVALIVFCIFTMSNARRFYSSVESVASEWECRDDVAWDKIRTPYTCEVRQPEKKSKFKGMKHFIAYNVIPSDSGTAVSRRFKHFDWLYSRLLEKFTCLSIPPIPEKQITGKYAEEFVEKRRERLERWLNRLARHPVVSQSEVFKHFLYCGENEKEWKAGKRKAEHDKLCGAAFFLTVRCPKAYLTVDEADEKIENSAQFFKTMEESVQRLNERCRSYGMKFEGVFRNSHKKFAMSILNLHLSFNQYQSVESQPLTDAILHTGEAYDQIGEFFGEQPRHDLQYLMEGLQEYAGILTTFPEIIHIHKSTVEKVKDCERKQNEEKVQADLVEQVTSRANVITNVTIAEINLFHEQRVVDFKGMMQSFLRQQITFYQRIVDKLQESLQMYDKV